MFAIKSEIVWFFMFIHVSNSQRRIQQGIDVEADKKYVVYIVKAPISGAGYDYWLCGGALVTSEFVVTSAACIKDVQYLYVIAGYKKYVVDSEIETDPCTSKMKKKVIYTCYPEGYELKYEQLDTWSFIDIGVAKVESPFDFQDVSFETLCSYIPGVIPIGFDAKHQEPNTDAVVFGWGHLSEWRKQEDSGNYNAPSLKYAPVMIIDKEDCKLEYEEYGSMNYVIETYMICSLGRGRLNDSGTPVDSSSFNIVPENMGCSNRKSWATNPEGPSEDCDEDVEVGESDKTRRKINESNSTMAKIRNINNNNKTRAETNRTTKFNRTDRTTLANNATPIKGPALTKKNTRIKKLTLAKRTKLTNKTYTFENSFMSNETGVFNGTGKDARRYGICQNDHGGPLVTWVGGHEILIGVASVFKVSEDYKCIGPFLYTSTQCNGDFLDCILQRSNFEQTLPEQKPSVDNRNHRRSFCSKSGNGKKHLTMERHISWLSHPAGPADNERHLRVQKPDKERLYEKERGSGSQAYANNPPNQVYPSNNKPSVSVDHAPNRFNIKAGENAANIDGNNTPVKNYVANVRYGPVVPPMMTNNMYTPNNAPLANKGPADESLKRFKLSYKPRTVYNGAQKNEPAPIEIVKNNRPAANYRDSKY